VSQIDPVISLRADITNTWAHTKTINCTARFTYILSTHNSSAHFLWKYNPTN